MWNNFASIIQYLIAKLQAKQANKRQVANFNNKWLEDTIDLLAAFETKCLQYTSSANMMNRLTDENLKYDDEDFRRKQIMKFTSIELDMHILRNKLQYKISNAEKIYFLIPELELATANGAASDSDIFEKFTVESENIPQK
ncbi:hypothetical protein [Paucilactobacillus sp. N302-9]